MTTCTLHTLAAPLAFQSRALDTGFFMIGLILLAIVTWLALLLLVGGTAILGLFRRGEEPATRRAWRTTAGVIRAVAWAVPFLQTVYTVVAVSTHKGLPVMPDALINQVVALVVILPTAWWVDRRARRLRDKHGEGSQSVSEEGVG